MRRTTSLWIALAILLTDQATKALVLLRFTDNTVVPIIPGLFRLVRVENPGIAFGLLSESASAWTALLLVLFSLGAIGMVVALLWRSCPSARAAGLGLGLVLGGATGNLVDRLLRGKVVDFLDVYVGSYHWPAFNVADSAICVGAAAVLWSLLVPRTAQREPAHSQCPQGEDKRVETV
jgi:signal peptidase II